MSVGRDGPRPRRRSKISTRRASAVLPTPTSTPSIAWRATQADRSSSRPMMSGAASAPPRSMKPATVQPAAVATSATARPCPPAPTMSRRRAIRWLLPRPWDGGPALPQHQLGEQEIPFRVDVDGRLEPAHDAAIVRAEHLAFGHEDVVPRDVDGTRRLVDRGRVLAANVLVALVEQRDRAVALERLHEVRVIRRLGHRLRGIRARLDDLRDGLVDVRADAERRRRLERDDQLGSRAVRFQPADGVLQDRHHPSFVARQRGRAQEGHLGAVAPRLGGDRLAVGRDQEARDASRLSTRCDGVADQRERAEGPEILARQPLRATARRNDAEDVGRRRHDQTFTQRRSAEARWAASMTFMVLKPSQPSHFGTAFPSLQAMKWRASSTYMSLSWQLNG